MSVTPSCQPGRPTSTSLFEVLANVELLEVSENSLREATHVTMAVSKFPLLSCANEPISHLVSPTVRPLLQILADTFHESYSVPHNIAIAYEHQSPYVSDASQVKADFVSDPIPLEKLIPFDGDGVVQLSTNHEPDKFLQV